MEMIDDTRCGVEGSYGLEGGGPGQVETSHQTEGRAWFDTRKSIGGGGGNSDGKDFEVKEGAPMPKSLP